MFIFLCMAASIVALGTLTQGYKAIVDIIDYYRQRRNFPKIMVLITTILLILSLVLGTATVISANGSSNSALSVLTEISTLKTATPSNITNSHGNTPSSEITPAITPSTTSTFFPTSTPSPILTSNSLLTDTPTPLPVGSANCTGGQGNGWAKWSANPSSAWTNGNGSMVNITDKTHTTTGPTLIGPPCGLIKRGSQITINFTAVDPSGPLYLMVQGNDMHWYSIALNYNGVNIEVEGAPQLFQAGPIISSGNSYTFVLEIAVDGNFSLLNASGGIVVHKGLSFIPNGQWGIRTFNGVFSIASISVN